ncbi:MAG: PAS domain S-box protein [Candidatus Cloacimonadota bacterium]|nr:MAG: PAS domain S-box protein [Candidatus Cloacimonadota bacterium]
MKNNKKTKEQLIKEIGELRQQINNLKKLTNSDQQAKKMLLNPNELYKALLLTSPDAVTITDLEGRIIEVSQQTLNMHGYENPEELLGTTALDLIAPEDHERALENMKKTLTGGAIRNVEYTLLKKDGTPFYGELDASLIRDAQGNPKALIATTRDITGQKLAQEELQRKVDEFSLTFENAKDAIIWADPETCLVTNCNKATEWLLEKKKEEIIGHHQKELHPPEKAEYYMSKFKMHIEQKGAVDDEAEIITKFGRTKPVFISASITTVGGKPIIQGIFHDISEQKLIEKSLRESEDKFRTLVEQSLQGIIIGQGSPITTVFVNTAIADILGYTVDELMNLSTAETQALIHPDDRKLFFDRYTEKLEGKPSPSHYELRAIRKDGSICWVEIFSTRIVYSGEPAVQAAFIDITERRKAEDALLSSEEQYRTLQSNIPVGIFRITGGADGRIVSSNPALVKMLGYEIQEEMAEIRVTDLYMNQEDRKKFVELLSTIGEISNYEVQLKRKDSSVFWGSLSVKAIIDKTGNVAYMDGILEDITERKEAERALQRSEVQYRTLQANIPVGLFRTTADTSGHIVSTNPALAEMFGYKDPEEMTTIRVADLYINQDDRNTFIEILKSKGEVSNYEVQFKRKDNSVFWGSLSARAIRDASGKIVYLDGILENITERKEAERALQRSEVQYRTLQANIPVGLFRTTADTSGHIVSTNPALAEMFGYKDPEEMTTIRVADLYINQDDRNTFIEILKSKGEVSNYEVQFKRKDNSVFWGSLSARAIRDASGKIVYLDGILENISARKQAQIALEESEEKYRGVVDNSLVGFYITQQHIIKFCNQKFVEMFGYDSSEQLIGKHAKNLIAPESWELVNKMVMLRESGEEETLQYVFKGRKKDGTIIDIETSGSRIFYEGKLAIQGNMLDITERKRVESKLKILASRDALTGVLNRGVALLLFAKQLQTAKRENTRLSICYLDLDGLKDINDTYGHQEGDEALKLVSRFLIQSLREADVVCRLGGDEFLLILPHCPLNNAYHVWERISRSVVTFNAQNIKPYIISLSRGFAEYNPDIPSTVDQLIANADMEMYKHKHSKSEE